MRKAHGEYEFDTEIERVDWDRVHSWLTETYWSPGIGREKVEKAGRNSSLVIGAYLGGEQAAYMRVVSDRTTFAWVADVFVDPKHRSKGIARGMVEWALESPEHQGLRRWVLATMDAHEIYASCGFEPLTMPERWMVKPEKPSSSKSPK